MVAIWGSDGDCASVLELVVWSTVMVVVGVMVVCTVRANPVTACAVNGTGWLRPWCAVASAVAVLAAEWLVLVGAADDAPSTAVRSWP